MTRAAMVANPAALTVGCRRIVRRIERRAAAREYDGHAKEKRKKLSNRPVHERSMAFLRQGLIKVSPKPRRMRKASYAIQHELSSFAASIRVWCWSRLKGSPRAVSDRKQRYCVLIVDDSRDSAESFARLLLAMGYDAIFTTDPRNALSEALRLKPHIAFLDIGMPHISGHELARTLRRRFSEEELKLVAVTGSGAPEDRAASRKAGFDAHVLKPMDPALVESIIKTVLVED